MAVNVILLAISVRVIIALATYTFFQPDEYFQSLEVAHHLVFGYGHLTWEWLTPKPIRSIIYPMLNVPIYLALKHLGLDNTHLLILGPKALHGLLASLTDIYVCDLATRVAGERYRKIAFWLSLTSLFNGLSLSRSLSNSLEASLTTVALALFPWDTRFPSWRNDYRKALIVAALACSIRPTNAIIWVYMVLTTMWQLRQDIRNVLTTAVDALWIGITTIMAVSAIDSWYYGSLTFTPMNFVATNLSSVSLFYGSSPWNYYISQAIPILCGTTLPFVIQAVLENIRPKAPPNLRRAVGLIVWTVVIYSFAGHKEWRFIHPLLPVLHILAAVALVDHHHIYNRSSGGKQENVNQFRFKLGIRRRHLLVFLANIPPILYLMFSHSRAQVDVIHYLRNLDSQQTQSVGFLMPCHSTPWQAYLHRPSLADSGRLWALGCEPPVGVNSTEYKDQTDVFYESPIAYLQHRFPSKVDLTFPPSPLPNTKPGKAVTHEYSWLHEWPQYLVAFGELLEDAEVAELLIGKGYQTVWHREYGWGGDARRRGGVTVLQVDGLPQA